MQKMDSGMTTEESSFSYLPDTLMAEIRQDVLNGSDFDFLSDDNNAKTTDALVDQVIELIHTKWINGRVASMVGNLTSITSMIPEYGSPQAQQSVPVWRAYLEKLKDFLKVWRTKFKDLIRRWVLARTDREQ
jgi:hypothetical protein